MKEGRVKGMGECMDEWIRCMDGRDIWMEGWVNVREEGWIEEGWIDGCLSEGLNRWMGRWVIG